MNMKEQIQIILNTLNQISVSGRRNIDLLLGAMIALERLNTQTGADHKEEDTHGEDH